MFVLAIMIIVLMSCDAIRVVRVTNLSKNTIEIRTDFPHRITHQKDSNGVEQEVLVNDFFIQNNSWREVDRNQDIQINSTSDELIIKLKPNQHFAIAGHIGTALIGIRSWDLNHSKLTIYTPTDTITANSREDIIKLFKNPKTKYIKKKDKKSIEMNNKYWKNIVIRD